MFREKRIVAHAYIGKEKQSKINYLTFYYKKLAKEEYTKPKGSRKKK